MRIYAKVVLLLVGFLCVFQLSQAAQISCIYKVTKLSQQPGGFVYGTFSGIVAPDTTGILEYMQICSLEVTANGVPVNTCKGILAEMLVAKSNQSNVRLWFDTSIVPGFTCGTTLSWVTLTGATGWYFGPSLE